MKYLAILSACLFITFSSSSQTIIKNPNHGISTASGLRMDVLELSDQSTTISFRATANPGNWISIPDKSYILPVGTTDTLYVKGTEDIPLNKRYTMADSGFVDFKIIFPPLSKGVSHFDYGEGNAGGNWAIYDIPTTQSPTVIPNAFDGDWFSTVTGKWELSLHHNKAIYKSKIWNYDEVKFKRKKGHVVLSNEEGKEELILKLDKQGVLFAEIAKDELITLSKAPVTGTTESDAPFTTPIFSLDTAVYSGYIEGYSPRAGIKTMSVSVNDILTGEQNQFVTKINPNGEFTFKVPLYYPHVVFVRSDIYNGSIFLEPGKSLFQYISPSAKSSNLLCMGQSASINSDMYKLRNLRGPDYRKLRKMVLETSQADYKSYMLEGMEQALRKLDKIKDTESIGAKAYQVKKFDLQYRYYSKIFEFKWDYESAYRKKNEIPRSQRNLDIKYDTIPEGYFDFITSELANNPLAVISTDYGSFINRLKYAEFLRPERMSINTQMLIDELRKSGYKFTADETAMIETFDRIESIRAEISSSEHSSKFKKRNEEFSEKYREQISEILKRYKKEGKEFKNISQVLIDEGIELTKDELELLDANDANEKSELSIKLKDELKSIGVKSSEFHNNHKDFMNEIFARQRREAREENLMLHCGIEQGLVNDIMNSQDVSRNIVSNLSPVNDQKLLQYQAIITTPFIGDYLGVCNEAIKVKIESNKLKGGYTLHDAPKTEADKVFDAIISKYKDKVVYVDFWATWCGPCRSGIQRIKPLKETMVDQDVVFVYITNQSSPETAYNNMIPDIKGEHYRLSTDEWNHIKGKFNISGIPHYVLVSKEGEVINPKLGHLSNKELKKLFAKHL